MSYEAGSVTAQIKLDTKDFDTKIKSLQGKIDDLKIHLQKNGLQDVSKQVEQFKKELDSSKTAIDNLKRVNEQYKKTISSLKKELRNLDKEHNKNQTTLDKVGESNNKIVKSTKKVSTQYSELGKSAEKASKGLKKVQQSWELNHLINGVEEATVVTRNLNKEITRTATQSKKLEADLFTAVTTETSKYMNSLGRGRKSNLRGLLDSDKAVWSNHDGIETRLFDGKRLREHLHKTFKGILTDDELKSTINDVFHHFGLGDVAHNVDGLWGISRDGLEKLNRHASAFGMTMEKLENSIRKVMAETSGMKEQFSTPISNNVVDNACKALEFLREEEIKTETEIRKLKQALNEVGDAKINFGGVKEFNQAWKNISLSFKRTSEEIERAISKFADTGKGLSTTEEFSMALRTLASYMKEVNNEFNRFEAESNKVISELSKTASINENWNKINNTFEKTQGRLQYVTTGFDRLTGQTIRTTQVLKTFNFALLEGVEKETIFYQRTVSLASAMQRMNSQGTKNWAGRGQFGYSQYIAQITQMNRAMEKQRQIQQTIKQQRLDQYYAKVNSATQKYWTQIREGTINLNTYKSKITEINRALQQQTQRTQRLATAQYKLFQKYHTTNLNTYKANMSEINAELEKQTTNTAKADANTRKLGKGLTSFNNGVVQTAHSGRILSNTLYQIRGALLSLKMIFTAMGGMALWGFAMEIAEGVKTTFQAKNEMEAQLKQNSKVSQGGIEYFNRELTELTKNYKKVNKYSIGETVSSVGLEFDLSAEQMKKALPIVTMIQSEYVRAGRKTEEASLAVKDILQGEFQRLSRETGVGKEELIAYGWDEDKENIDGLLDALKKAGLARHWDIFAKKATSLNDVLTITKSRFEETGADILDSASPAIVEGFNMIIGAIDGVQKAFNGMNAFWRNIAWFGGGTAFFGGLATLLPVITKGMGLADIATIGWSKSIGTAVFNLNKAEVAQYGFRKALTAVIAGTKASEIANVRWTKSIMGRVLGVKQGTLAEKGYLTALVEHKMSLKGLTPLMDKAGISSLKWYQKLGYLSGGLKESEVATAGLGRSLLKTATSAKVLRFALVGITGIALVAWLSAVGTQADLVKKRIQAFNEIVETGAEKLKETQSQIDAYQKTVDKYQNSTNKDEQNKAKIAKANIDILEGNKKELQLANRLAQSYKKQNEEREKSITLAQSTFRKNALIKAGHTEAEATEKQAFWVDKINQAQYEITNSYNKQYEWLESSEKHINEKVTLMKKEADLQKSQIKDAKEAEAFEKNALKLRDKYIMEYATVAEEAGEHLKQFYQGDIMAGAYFLLDQFKLRWIDLWYDEHFVNFWKSLQQTWERLKPVVYGLKDALQGLGDSLLDFLSTDIGQATLVFSGLGVAIGGIGLKIAKWVSGSGSVFDVLKKLPSKLKKVAGGWKDVADKAEDASKKTGGATSTGGIAGDVSEGKMNLKEGMLSDLKGNVRKYANYATQLAFMMGLITEAILLIQAPMWALAETGKTFKAKEKSIRAGIEGLQVVAPTILAILVPVVALMKVFDKFGDVFTKSSAKAIGSAVVGIAVGLGLVAETILMIIPSLWALGALGDQLIGMESQVKKGTEAMKIVSESLYYLLPFIPALAGGILLGIAMFESGGLGAILTVAVAGGIAIGLGLVAETIYLLQAPLWAIGEIGNNFKDLSNVKRGAEAIKLTGEALTYVEEGMRSLALIQWEVLAGYIAKLIGINIGADLTNLTDEGGFFDQLEQFTTQFNQLELTPINPDKVTVLNGISTGLSTVGTALQNAKTAIDNIPAELKNGGVNLNYDMQTDTTSIQSGEATSYFEQLKEPLKQLGEFITWFNSGELQIPAEGVNADKLQAINDSATMLQSVNDAVTKVRDVMGNSLLTGGLANVNSGGTIPIGGLGALWGLGKEVLNMGGSGTGSYKSSLGSSFQQMEDIISDLSTFSTNISSYTMGGGGENQSGNLESLTTFVQGVSTQISTLVSTLNSKVPEAKQNAESLGKGIIDGIKSGLRGIEKVGNYIATTVSNSIQLNKDTTYNTANSFGKTTASKFKEGVDPMSDYMTWEMFYVGKAIDDSKEGLGQKAYDLASYMSSRFKEGNDMHSPGIMARSMQSELGYIAGYLSTSNLPQLAFDLANMLSSNFKLDFNLGNFQLPDMTQWTSQLSTVIPTISGIKTQVSTNFNTMKTNVQNSFNGIVSKTQTSMSAMKTSTISHIGNIKTSWKGMQDALIASAENIKSQTSSKINTLKTNLGDFWNKVKHPDQLIGSVAGGHKGSIRRRYAPTLKSSRGHYAGGGTGGLFKPKRSTSRSPDDNVMEYIRCVLEKGDQCYAGGWNFNWTKSISDKFKGWNTHFNAYSLDKYLNVGKFENSNFPVKGNAQVAKDYIFDVISATSYAKYFDSHFGNNPVSALRAGAFNCWDGTQIVLALARAFGFSGSIGHGTWNGVGHVWANIAGLGIIDPTAIQQRGSFTSSAVKGYSAGAMPRRYASDKNLPSGNNTTNHNEVHIHIEGDVYGVDDLNSKIEEGANRVARQLFRNSYSGV